MIKSVPALRFLKRKKLKPQVKLRKVRTRKSRARVYISEIMLFVLSDYKRMAHTMFANLILFMKIAKSFHSGILSKRLVSIVLAPF